MEMEVVPLNKTLEIANEKQVKLVINEVVLHLMCTPVNLEELAIGFLISEGLVSPSEKIAVQVDGDTITVKANTNPVFKLRSSGCPGVFREKEELPEVIAEERFSLNEARNSLKHLDTEEYKRTRGYHIAALIGKDGLIARAYDVGRHNAIDKAIGMGIKKELNLRRSFLLTSGRISQGIAAKCVRASIPLVVSKAAILDSAMEICMKTGLSAVSFATGIMIRGDALIL
jgi:FdhD protein